MQCGNNFQKLELFLFQSSSSPKAGCNQKQAVDLLQLHCFNPHPARRLDAIVEVGVSNMQQGFQSSSSPKAGCNAIENANIATVASFNPHPARRLDAISVPSSIVCPNKVFQSSSSPKAGCNVFMQK